MFLFAAFFFIGVLNANHENLDIRIMKDIGSLHHHVSVLYSIQELFFHHHFNHHHHLLHVRRCFSTAKCSSYEEVRFISVVLIRALDRAWGS